MGRTSVTAPSASRNAFIGSIWDTSRFVPAQRRCRVIAIPLVIIVVTAALFIQLPATLWRQQLAPITTRDAWGVRSGAYSADPVSYTTASDYIEASVLTAPSKLFTKPHLLQKKHSDSSHAFKLSTEAVKATGNRNSSSTNNYTYATSPAPPANPAVASTPKAPDPQQLPPTSISDAWRGRSGAYSGKRVSYTTTSGLFKISAVTTPSKLFTKPHSLQKKHSDSSHASNLSTEAVTAIGELGTDSRTSNSTNNYTSPTSHASPSAAAVTTTAVPQSCPPPPLLTVNGGGRLGNKLCQYFTLWAEHHTNFTNTSVWIKPKMASEFSRQFAGQRSITELPSGCRPKKLHAIRLDAIESGLRAGHDVCIGGGVCDVAGFARYRDRMLSEFPWKEDLTQVATARLAAAAHRHGCRPTNCTFIGVHMRRTDYTAWVKQRMSGQPVGTEYFQCALSWCRRRYPGAVFIVASDDVKWARANILGEDVALASALVPAGKLASRAAALDMATLSLCNHTIVSYGTFSYMAAFMAGGDVVAPTGYSSNEHFAADGMIRSGWPVTLLHYRTCREVPLEDRTPFTGLSLTMSCDG